MKQEIEIEGLPEGYEIDGVSIQPGRTGLWMEASVKLKKIQLRRIVLEETDEEANMIQFMDTGDVQLRILGNKIWKEVEE